MSRWPAIPTRVQGAGGPIRVRLVKRPTSDEGDECWGTWCEETRTIHLARGAKPGHRWKTFVHELVHAAVSDTGLHDLLSHDGEEALCNGIAGAAMALLTDLLDLP